MLKPFIFYLRATVVASCVIPYAVWLYNAMRKVYGFHTPCEWSDLWVKLAVIVAITGAAITTVLRLTKWCGRSIDELSRKQSDYLKQLNTKRLTLAIFGSAAISLIAELAMIRWQSSIFELFALYKNFGLLACFLGLGLGYAISSRKQIPVMLVIPLLTWQILLLSLTKYGPHNWNIQLLRAMPVTEQLNMGLHVATKGYEYAAMYGFLSVVFILTALTFVPIGQLCGVLLDQKPRLQAYGLNLLGSLAGVAVFFGFSLLWTPPLVWFSIIFICLILFQAFDRRTLLTGSCAAALAVTVLAWPSSTFWEQIYSPYQLLERGYGYGAGANVRAAGHYFQEISVFANVDRERIARLDAQRELPYRIYGPAERVAIVGAGSGNDAAAAIRCDVQHVDAIEIDPAILEIGKYYHPEKPYSNPRVSPIVNDARSFLRNTDEKYDIVVYGLLDSHALLSTASNVRVDSFVYTVEGLRESRARLKEGGMISLAFCVMSPEIGRKLYLMLQEAFDGQAPLCIQRQNNSAVVFLIREGMPIEINDNLFAMGSLNDVTAKFADPTIKVDLSTDDWPFFYMPKRVYPVSYVIVVGIILALSLVFVRPFFKADSNATPKRFQINHAVFFLLGAGFMLVETKSITELGLTFGNTWHVIGIVIAGILTMAFIANLVVYRLRIRGLAIPFTLLLGSLAAGLLVAKSGGFSSTFAGRIATLAVLTSPMFFSGICFSTMLRYTTDMSSAMAANLIGAMAGGLLEYNSMYFGFQWLYWLALGVYGTAMVFSWFGCRPAALEQHTQAIQDAAANRGITSSLKHAA